MFYVPAFNTMKDFHYNDPARSLGANTYNELPQELLEPQVPHLFPQEQHTRTRKLAEATTSTTSPNTKEEHLVITSLDHQQILSQIKIL